MFQLANQQVLCVQVSMFDALMKATISLHATQNHVHTVSEFCQRKEPNLSTCRRYPWQWSPWNVDPASKCSPVVMWPSRTGSRRRTTHRSSGRRHGLVDAPWPCACSPASSMTPGKPRLQHVAGYCCEAPSCSFRGPGKINCLVKIIFPLWKVWNNTLSSI